MDPRPGPEPTSDAHEDTLERLLATAFRRDARWVGHSTMLGGDRTPPADEPTPDRLDRYEVRERIGEGGVGVVYRVRDERLERTIALKVLRTRFARDAEHVGRFTEEARLLGQLSHPGIVPVHETGTLEDGRPFFTMRLVEGETLARILRRRAKLDSDRTRVLQVLGKTCEALSYAHSLGITHGDVKPQNVMVGRFGEVQVMDFGFARQKNSEGESSESPKGSAANHGVQSADRSAAEPASSGLATPLRSTRAGTPAYMAPEQAKPSGPEISPRTDVFGLGGILCEILTGDPPHLGDSRTQVIEAAAAADLDAAQARLSSCGADPTLVQLAIDCLCGDPERRPADARVVAERLSAYEQGVEARARAAEVGAAEARATLKQGKRAQLLTIALVSAVAVAVIVVVVLLGFSQRQRDQRRASTATSVAEATAESRRLLTLAGVRRTEAETLLRDALAAARRAEALARTADGEPESLATAQTLIRSIESQADKISRAHRLGKQLAELRHHVGDERPAGDIDTGYVNAFAAASVPALTPTRPAADTLVQLELGNTLIEALDDWCALRKRSSVPDAEAWKAPLALVRAIDADPWRNALRDAWSELDADRLERLAATAFEQSQSPFSLGLLGRALTGLGRSKSALDFYRRACSVHPHDARLCHDHAMLVRADGPLGDPATAIRLLWMACASQPDDAHLLTDLGLAMLSGAEDKEAPAVLQRAVGIQPLDARAWFVLGVARRKLNLDRGEMLAALERAAKLGFDAGAVLLADEYQADGRLEEAIVKLEPIVARQPGNRIARCTLALMYQRVGSIERASSLAASFVSLPIPSDALALGMGAIAFDSGRFELAVERFSEAARLAGSEASELYRVAVMRREQAKECVAVAKGVVDLAKDAELPANRARLRILGRVAARLEHPVIAARALTKLLESADTELELDESDLLEGSLACFAAAAEQPEAASEWQAKARKWLGTYMDRLADGDLAAERPHGYLRSCVSLLRLHPKLAFLRQPEPASRPTSESRSEEQELARKLEILRKRVS